MKISLIVAMARNRVIGLNNQLPWRLPADLKRFKQLTLGHYLLMGRKTYESIGRPLPGRTMVVITRQPDYAAPEVLVAHSLAEALTLAAGESEVFIAGGAELYAQTLARADRIYLTLIEAEIAGDTFFPEFETSRWRLSTAERFEPDEKNTYTYSFLVYDRSDAEESHDAVT